MDCETCTEMLVEFLYEELSDDDANAVETHLAKCEDCAAALARLKVGNQLADMLELVEPPATILDSVMVAAREKAAGRVSAPAPAIAPERGTTVRAEAEDEESGPWAAVLKWVGGLAMRPQLAMAMSLVLIVGLGMWYLPALRQNDPADSQSIVSPDPSGEVGPSASLVPAEPLELEANPQTGRMTRRDEEPEAPRPAVARAARPVTETAEEAPTNETPELALAEAPPQPGPRAGSPAAASDDAVMAAEGTAPGGEVIEEALPDPRVALAERDVAPATPGATRAATPSQGRPADRPAVAFEQQTSPMPEPAPPTVQPPEDTATSDAPRARYARGLQRYRSRDYRGAAEEFEAVITRPGPDRTRIPSSLDHLAQSQRRAGNCPAAIHTYDRLIRQHPRYSGVGEAMLGLARCYQRLGRLSDARRVLEQARTRPSTAAAARLQLAELAQRERARDAVEEPAEAASEASPE